MLDVGYANAEPRYLRARDALMIPFLVGLDLAAAPQSCILGVAGDALALPFRPTTFSLIFAISVIEHIGRDNSVYGVGEQRAEFGDLEAARGLASLVQPGGRLLITVPFGRLEDHGWFVQHDLLAHQMAGSHSLAMSFLGSAVNDKMPPVERARLANSARGLMDSFQNATLTLQRLRTGGCQSIVVQRIQVQDTVRL